MTAPLRTLVLLCLAAAAPLRAQDAAPRANRIRDLLTARRDALAAQLASPGESPEENSTAAAALARLQTVLAAPAEYRVQVLLGEVVERQGVPQLVRSGWRVDDEYFYPASTVKLCGAVAALERMNELLRSSEPDLDPDTPLAFHPTRSRQELESEDPSNLDGGKITLRHLIRKVFLVSDNAAFNRLYDFCGQTWLNERMWRAGCASTRISHRLDVKLSRNENKHTPAVELRYPLGARLVGERWGTLDLDMEVTSDFMVGRTHLQDSELVKKPMSFFQKNGMRLGDLQTCLARVVRPDIALEKGEPFDLTAPQRELLLEAMSTYPADSSNPVYDRAHYPDDYCKFFLPGLERVVPKPRLKIHNKVGLAYGFASDNAYVVDTGTGRAFFLAATIYANANGVVGDGVYEYETLALPFLADLAELVARDVWRDAK